ncbi:MAG: type II toxin-antitoxin system HipA family toxin YjjJ [Azonexus sp.]|jgi:hypothetical protein|nr:type II toxin-antitoxin system HipA family toxin YjjJ [Azonexus sp.]
MRPRNDDARQRLLTTLRRGPASVSFLAKTLGVTARTVLRWLDEHPDVCAAGAASRTRYALGRPLRGRLERHPLYCVDEQGGVVEMGSLTPVFPDGCLCSLHALAWPVGDAAREGWWEGLPYPLHDMRPQGFLGRGFARQQSTLLEISPDPRQWSDDDIVHILTRTGWDTSGNLILGEAALQQWQSERLDPRPAIAEAGQAAAYARLAHEASAQGISGSSIGGEFPKFTARRSLSGAKTEHVIVKFSGEILPGATERWSDLLICEHLAALQLARLPGLTSASTRIIQGAGRTFLEAERFDRLGRFGRQPLLSFAAINAHLLGLAAADWRAPLRQLAKLGYLSAADLEAGLRLCWFGKLIANTDMHPGNLSFIPAAGHFRLAPAYDMLPMAYAPLPGGEVPGIAPTFALPLPAEQAVWRDACAAAIAFWQEAAEDARISATFRAICRANAERLTTLQQGSFAG